MILISNDFWHNIKIDNFDPYNVLLAISTNIPQRLKTGFVLQGHILAFISTHETHINSLFCMTIF